MSDESEKPFAKLPFFNETLIAKLTYFNLDGEYTAGGKHPVPAGASLEEICEELEKARDRGLSRLHILIEITGRAPHLLLLKTPPVSQS